MISLNIELAYPPSVHLTGLIEQLLVAADYFAPKHSLPILWDPHEMALQTMLCMSPRPIPGCDLIMPELPSLRQMKLWLRSGLPFIPSLKRLGFSGNFYKGRPFTLSRSLRAREIEQALAQVREFFQADRCALLGTMTLRYAH